MGGGAGRRFDYGATSGSEKLPLEFDLAILLQMPASNSSVPGDASLGNTGFHKYMARRKNKDAGGYFEVVVHGSAESVEIVSGGITYEVDHRTLAAIIKRHGYSPGRPVRLLSCSTGVNPDGFAQHLANKLGVPVEAPTDLLWANADGTYFVAGYTRRFGRKRADLSKRGYFKTFYPRGKNE